MAIKRKRRRSRLPKLSTIAKDMPEMPHAGAEATMADGTRVKVLSIDYMQWRIKVERVTGRNRGAVHYVKLFAGS